MKLKRARRPQNMFLFDPEFRYHSVDEPVPNISTGNYAANVMIGNQGEQNAFIVPYFH